MRAQSVFAAIVVAGLVLGPLSAHASEPQPNTPGGVSAPEGVSFVSATGLSSAAAAFEAERDLIFQQANALRAENGLAPLRRNAALDEIAMDWAVQQARVSTMSHRPNFTAMYPAGWTRAAENVAFGYAPSAVHAAWANSPGHRTNLLSANTDIGIGIAANSNGRLYYTQNFGRYASAPPSPPGTILRIAGNDRYATSALISASAFSAGASTVYIASGADFPDALSAAALAGAANGPLLLVTRDSVPASILTELRRLAPDRIVVAGGPGVVSEAVLATLRTVTPNVDRVFGTNRFDTARQLALDAYGASGAPIAFLATGSGFADALAAGPAAASVDAPVLLINGSAAQIDAATLTVLAQLGTTSVVIVGGTGVVSEGIRFSLESEGFAVERFAGTDRYSTASQLATAFFSTATSAYLATGLGFADALSGGAAAGAVGAPLYTTQPSCVSPPPHTALRAQGPDQIFLLGGLGSLLPAVAGFYRC
ncbi:MAG: hypothetical protein C0444_11755 [Microbacterium sp.]|nr:hypothetical protein [Microbacterium sp.]MBA4346781.1 hypothetical protein [Microbacterium sp.]